MIQLRVSWELNFFTIWSWLAFCIKFLILQEFNCFAIEKCQTKCTRPLSVKQHSETIQLYKTAISGGGRMGFGCGFFVNLIYSHLSSLIVCCCANSVRSCLVWCGANSGFIWNLVSFSCFFFFVQFWISCEFRFNKFLLFFIIFLRDTTILF